MKGYVSNIQRFSIHDGDGIRTTVFFSGCNLRCWWCHNPETLEMNPRIQFFKNKCTGCGECVTICRYGAQRFEKGVRIYDNNACHLCGKCIDVCHIEALKYSCCLMDENEIMDEILKDMAFYKNTGGGATFSGGEPFMQPDFLTRLLELCRKNKIGTVVETAANVDYRIISRAIPYIDTIICDMKTYDSKHHMEGTGVSNKKIIENIKRLSQEDCELGIRIPIIPNYNDNLDELLKMAEFLKSILPAWIELMPFHNLARTKYESLNMQYKGGVLKDYDVATMDQFIKIFRDYELNIKDV